MLNFLKRKSSSSGNNGKPGGLPEIASVGTTAGELWGLLADNGTTKLDQLVDRSSASRDQVLLALGWLARESKIDFDGTSVSLLSNECLRVA